MRKSFAETDIWCFSRSYLKKRHEIFCWSGCLLGHMIFGKGIRITQQTVDYIVVLICLATLCWSSRTFLKLVISYDAKVWFILPSLLIFICSDVLELLVIFQGLFASSIDSH